MDYKRIYNEIIENRKNNRFDGYTESHHITPKSCGGSNKKENLVELSAREHFICHYLLTKMYPYKSKEFYSMIKAFSMMGCSSDNHERYINSRLYESNKKNFIDAQKIGQCGKNNSQYGTRWKWIHNDTLKEIKKISFNAPIPSDWEYGLTFNQKEKKLKKELEQQEKKLFKEHEKKEKKLKNQIEIKKKAEEKELVKKELYEIEREKTKELYLKMYNLYCENDFKYIQSVFDYKFTIIYFRKKCKELLGNVYVPKGPASGLYKHTEESKLKIKNAKLHKKEE
ncbi:MAG: HNH endonuclease [Bacteroidales bacterium]|jgi:hypothetical protein